MYSQTGQRTKVMLGLLKVWAWGLQYLNQTGFHVARLFHSFLAWICCSRQSLCINYYQKLICEIQLLFALDIPSVEFFLMKKNYQCLWDMRQIILNFGGNSFPYGNFTCTGETKKLLRLWGKSNFNCQEYHKKKRHYSISCFRVDEEYFS